MKISEVTQRPQSSTQNIIIDLINEAAAIFGEGKLYGGNCGMFAVALATKLQEQGVESELGILFQNSENIEQPKDLIGSELMVYHVVTTVDGVHYDGTGPVNVNTLLDIAEDQYHDHNPGFFSEVEPFAASTFQLIRNETNWNTSAVQFLQRWK